MGGRSRGDNKGKKRVSYVYPAPQPDFVHPVDLSNVRVLCQSCTDNTPAPPSFPGCCVVKLNYFLPTDTDCDACLERVPHKVYDFKSVDKEKMFEIVATYQVDRGRRMIEFCGRHEQSREVVKRVVKSHIREAYKNVRVAKRPKETIDKVSDVFSELDNDTLGGREKIIFQCKNGIVSFCCGTINIVAGSGP